MKPESLDLLWNLSRGEAPPDVLAWLRAGAQAFFRDRRSPGFDRALGLPDERSRAVPLRDFWLRRAYAHCTGSTAKARIGVLLKEIDAVARIWSHIGPNGRYQESGLSEFRRAVYKAMQQGARRVQLRQLERILGASDPAQPMTRGPGQDCVRQST